jgi:hypothetical protein
MTELKLISIAYLMPAKPPDPNLALQHMVQSRKAPQPRITSQLTRRGRTARNKSRGRQESTAGSSTPCPGPPSPRIAGTAESQKDPLMVSKPHLRDSHCLAGSWGSYTESGQAFKTSLDETRCLCLVIAEGRGETCGLQLCKANTTLVDNNAACRNAGCEAGSGICPL